MAFLATVFFCCQMSFPQTNDDCDSDLATAAQQGITTCWGSPTNQEAVVEVEDLAVRSGSMLKTCPKIV